MVHYYVTSWKGLFHIHAMQEDPIEHCKYKVLATFPNTRVTIHVKYCSKPTTS